MHMKRSSLLLMLLTVAATSIAQSVKKQEPDVQQTIQNMFTALSNSDTADLKKFCTSDVNFYEYGQVWTIDTLIQKVILASKATDFKRTNQFEFVSTTIKGNTAWTTYYLQSTITRNGKEELVKWMETVVLVKEKKKWKINVLHSTRLLKN